MMRIARRYEQIFGFWLDADCSQHVLGAGPRPFGGADEAGADTSRNTGKGDKLVERFEFVAKLLEGKRSWVIYHAGDG